MMLRENSTNDGVTSVLIVWGLIMFLYACMGIMKCYYRYTQKAEQVPNVEEKGMSTAVDVYQLQPSRHRRPSSPYDSCAV
jgi:hypothetical protein